MNQQSKTERTNETAEFEERANKDSYFAAKEHELNEALKTEFHKTDAARRAARGADDALSKVFRKLHQVPVHGIQPGSL